MTTASSTTMALTTVRMMVTRAESANSLCSLLQTFHGAAGDRRRDAGEADRQADQAGAELFIDTQRQAQGLALELEAEGRAVVDAEAVRVFLDRAT